VRGDGDTKNKMIVLHLKKEIQTYGWDEDGCLRANDLFM